MVFLSQRFSPCFCVVFFMLKKVELRVPSGIYYPSVSLYSNASGTVQLGPEFAFPPSASVCPVQWGGAHLLDGSTLGKLFVRNHLSPHLCWMIDRVPCRCLA
jgi:hypothetical protein